MKNVSKLTVTVWNETLYIGNKGVRFADIMISKEVKGNEKVRLLVDIGYSDGLEISEL